MTLKTQRLLTRARKIANKGEIEEAEKLYSMVLEDSPENKEAKDELSALKHRKLHQEPPVEKIHSVISLFNNNQAQEALDEVKTLINGYPNSALLYNIRGSCIKAIGQLDEAVKDYEKALALKPDYAEVLYNLGITLRELGQIDAAINSYKQALTIKPDYFGAHNNLGNIFLDLGQLDAAADHFEWAVAYKPDFADAYNNLGVVCRQREQLHDAIKNFEKAIDIKPDYIEAHSNLGHSLNLINQEDAALKCYETALAINPNYVLAHINMGSLFQETGKIDLAIKQYEKVLAMNPNHVLAYYNLSAIEQYTLSDDQVAKMLSLFSTDNLSLSERFHLCFALVFVYDNLDNQDELFRFLHEGNRLRKEELNYSLEKSQELSSFVREQFSSPPSDIEQSLSFEPSTNRPIFIVGMPRSGTTLVEQIISSHNEVYGAGELTAIPTLIGQEVKNYITHGSNIASTTIGDMKLNLANTYSLPEEAFLSIRQQYLDELSRFKVPENVITDKLPLNFQYIGFILSAFPEAKIVHLKRDARATCWSNYQCFHLNNENGFSYNIDDLTGFYGLYVELMDFWHQLYPGKIYDICYEDLTTNQEDETRKLLEYCDLDWDENCLNFHKNQRAVKTASSLQVRQKMYQGSSEAWKQYEAHLKPLIKALDSY
jgi:tetratricopeptide (TPR) repeat protein